MSRIKDSILELVLEPWTENDLPLLSRLQGDPRMMTFLGGVEHPEKIAERL